MTRGRWCVEDSSRAVAEQGPPEQVAVSQAVAHRASSRQPQGTPACPGSQACGHPLPALRGRDATRPLHLLARGPPRAGAGWVPPRTFPATVSLPCSGPRGGQPSLRPPGPSCEASRPGWAAEEDTHLAPHGLQGSHPGVAGVLPGVPHPGSRGRVETELQKRAGRGTAVATGALSPWHGVSQGAGNLSSVEGAWPACAGPTAPPPPAE